MSCTVVTLFGALSGHLPVGIEGIHEDLSQGRRSAGRGSCALLPEYSSGALGLEPDFSVVSEVIKAICGGTGILAEFIVP
jgi:hypothetical protein